jgi:type VI secretion system protein VasD
MSDAHRSAKTGSSPGWAGSHSHAAHDSAEHVPAAPRLVGTGLAARLTHARRLGPGLQNGYLLALLIICALVLSACGGSKPVKPSPAHAQFIVSGDVNPDNSGRASPVVVRLFQLRNDGEFATADFFSLYDKEKETLGASFISREEYVLAPGETRTLELAVNPDARFIAALAA